jgi:glyoxylase-like metal-dependent hydrolase (beta-lactamase superfamily II)
MRSLIIATLLISFTRIVAAAAADQEPDWSKIQIKATKVAGQVYLLEGFGQPFTGGNIGASIGPDGILIIDDKFAPLAPKLQAALASLSKEPLRFVLNTHLHQDHSGGNPVLGKSATIIAHDNTRARLAKDGWGDGKPVPAEALPIITFADAITMHVNGEDVRVMHVPAGHTDTDVIVYFPKSHVVHMGDDYFCGMYPFIDFKSGGSVKGYIAAGEQLIGMIPDDAKIIPGHGPISNKTELRAWVNMLKDVSTTVAAGIKAGKTLAQIQKEKPTAKHDATFGHGFFTGDQFVEELFQGLSPQH